MTAIDITYVTSSNFKREENEIFGSNWTLGNGKLASQCFRFEFRPLAIKEVLEVSIEAMVTAEVKTAYAVLKVPCIVEHAGLIFSDYYTTGYPGGLTKAMWNTLGESFVKETHSANRDAVARAVVAYCDGQRTFTFVGETQGRISAEPRGSRSFYWDTVFIPTEFNPAGLTYAEIVAHQGLGLKHKVTALSQSSKAMAKFLDWRLTNRPQLWQVSH
jgi:XTP/dITP diphosphohydrolase